MSEKMSDTSPAVGRGYLVCVDDDLALLQTLEQELNEHFGETHEVLAVTSAEQALEAMYGLGGEGKRLEVVISDLMLEFFFC